MNKAKYPDIVNEDGSIDYVTRITYDLQRLAVKRMTELCFGIPVKRIYKPNNDGEQKVSQNVGGNLRAEPHRQREHRTE